MLQKSRPPTRDMAMEVLKGILESQGTPGYI